MWHRFFQSFFSMFVYFAICLSFDKTTRQINCPCDKKGSRFHNPAPIALRYSLLEKWRVHLSIYVAMATLVFTISEQYCNKVYFPFSSTILADMAVNAVKRKRKNAPKTIDRKASPNAASNRVSILPLKGCVIIQHLSAIDDTEQCHTSNFYYSEWTERGWDERHA